MNEETTLESGTNLQGSVTVTLTSAIDTPVEDGLGVPTDLDGDGRFEDGDGDGEVTTDDVRALFQNLDSDTVQNNPDAFDFDGDGDVTVGDVVALFRDIV
mgnify:CR=1 FL=1